MIRTTLLFILLSIGYIAQAQETIEVSNKLSPELTEKYHVLKSNNEVKQGLYQAIYKRKTVIASGGYTEGKKTGMWHFYDPAGKVIQHYNYSTKELLYLAPQDSTKYIEYNFDKKVTNSDRGTIPVRIGGNFYGYLPYIKLFKIASQDLYSSLSLYAILQLLISPYGRLAECKLLIKDKVDQRVVDTYILNNELLSDEDRTFVPATINHENVSATINILCKIQPDGSISIY
jgi:hypothetical protein